MSVHPLQILTELTQLTVQEANGVDTATNIAARRSILRDQLGAIVVREFAQAGSLIDQLPLVKESLFNPTVQAIHAGPLREFLPVYYHYLLERVGHLPPFRELQSHELDFLVAQAALPANEARSFSGAVSPETLITVVKFESWFLPARADAHAFSFCEALSIINEIWPFWNSELQRSLPGVLWNGRTIHGFISGTEAKAFLHSASPGTFLIRFGSSGGLTVDVKNSGGRLEKKNISVVQLNDRSLHRWLHEMDGAEMLQRLHVPGGVALSKADAFPHEADQSGYVQPDEATFGEQDAGSLQDASFSLTSGYENIDD
eukprot:TRINITY_DN6132_c0_g1_i1.p1 TRINITY_DN6132_c0_g1~~TRINITY_DN6132_c0_g1_i1.p1  ORF type:complete len:330 (-),score=42.20 TRINITY_DN6132_c0_g1_i1:45-992(-)